MGNSGLEDLLERDYVFSVVPKGQVGNEKPSVFLTSGGGYHRLIGLGYTLILIDPEKIHRTVLPEDQDKQSVVLETYVDSVSMSEVNVVTSEKSLNAADKRRVAEHIYHHKKARITTLGSEVTKISRNFDGGTADVRYTSKIKKAPAKYKYTLQECGVDTEGVPWIRGVWRGDHDDFVEPLKYNCFNTFIKTNQKEEPKMTQRNKVKVTLIDNDQALDVAHSLVFETEMLTDTTNRETILMEVMVSEDIKAAIVEHNKVRSKQLDLAILKNTGREVMLRPIKLRDLTWTIN